MRYWDSSAIVPLLVDESNTAQCEAWLRGDPQIATWWLSKVECASTLNRLRRHGSLSASGIRTALADLEALAKTFVEIQPNDVVRTVASRLLRIHPLRAADVLQLASAVLAAGEERGGLEFVSYDTRLTAAADIEGFSCLVWRDLE